MYHWYSPSSSVPGHNPLSISVPHPGNIYAPPQGHWNLIRKFPTCQNYLIAAHPPRFADHAIMHHGRSHKRDARIMIGNLSLSNAGIQANAIHMPIRYASTVLSLFAYACSKWAQHISACANKHAYTRTRMLTQERACHALTRLSREGSTAHTS